MNDVRRYDRPAALIAHIACKLTGNKDVKMKDFMPFAMEEDRTASLADIAAAMGVMKHGR